MDRYLKWARLREFTRRDQLTSTTTEFFVCGFWFDLMQFDEPYLMNNELLNWYAICEETKNV